MHSVRKDGLMVKPKAKAWQNHLISHAPEWMEFSFRFKARYYRTLYGYMAGHVMRWVKEFNE